MENKIINHDNTKEILQKIIKMVRAQYWAFNDYNDCLVENDKFREQYTEQYIQERKEIALNKLQAVGSEHLTRVEEYCNSILETELENDKVFNLDDVALQNVISLFAQLGANINYGIVESSFNDVRGDRAKTEILINLCKKHGVEIPQSAKDLTRETKAVVTELENALTDFSIHVSTTTLYIKLPQTIKSVGEYFGIDITEDLSILETGLFKELALRESMGLK